MIDLRDSMRLKDNEFIAQMVGMSSSNHHDSLPALEPASVLLIDRIEDLYSPCSHGSSKELSPMAHRILSTINSYQSHKHRRSGGVDVCLTPTVLLEQANCFLEAEDRRIPLETSFSALSALPLQLPPSISFSSLKSSPELKELSRSLFSESEETFREQLCSMLRAAVLAEGGSLPPPSKKRGFGAEVLALLQALIVSGRDQDQVKTLGYSPSISLKYEGLLSLALAVVEAMQRSSMKQFSAVCSWLTSYDCRESREEQFVDYIRRNSSITDPSTIFQAGVTFLTALLSADKLKKSESGPPDMSHTFLQLIRSVFSIHSTSIYLRANDENRLASLSGNAESSKSERVMRLLSESMVDYLLKERFACYFMNFMNGIMRDYCSTPEEIRYLERLGMLSPLLASDLLQHQEACARSLVDEGWDPIDDNDDDEATEEKILSLNLYDHLRSLIDTIVEKVSYSKSSFTPEIGAYPATSLVDSFIFPMSAVADYRHRVAQVNYS